MQVKLLDYGVPSEMQPKRAHANDVGADVYALKTVSLRSVALR